MGNPVFTITEAVVALFGLVKCEERSETVKGRRHDNQTFRRRLSDPVKEVRAPTPEVFLRTLAQWLLNDASSQ